MSRWLVAIAVVGLAAPAYAEAPVAWDVDAATTSGAHCRIGVDAFAIASGADVAVIFSDMGVDLVPDEGANAVNKRCRVVIPLALGERVYLTDLEQFLHVGWARTGDAYGEVWTRVKLLTGWVGAIDVPIDGAREAVASFRTEHRRTSLRTPPGWCRRRNPRAELRLELGVSGKRRDRADAISIRIHGADLRYEASVAWARCR